MDKSVWPLLIKVMMLVVTLLWIGGMLYGATMGFVGTYQDYQVVNREAGIYWNPDKTDFVNRDTVASVALTRAFFLGVCFPTAIYGVVMLLLFVCWFVSRG